jgi:hypothetical protein
MFYSPKWIGLLLMHSNCGCLYFHASKTTGTTNVFAAVTLVLRSEGVPEVVLRDLASKNNTRDA